MLRYVSLGNTFTTMEWLVDGGDTEHSVGQHIISVVGQLDIWPFVQLTDWSFRLRFRISFHNKLDIGLSAWVSNIQTNMSASSEVETAEEERQGGTRFLDTRTEVEKIWKEVEKTLNQEKRSLTVDRNPGWKTVRIFVSSTFRDFHSERDVLVKEVCTCKRLAAQVVF